MWLTIGSGEGQGLSVKVEGERFLVGTGEECQLRVADRSVAPLHAYFQVHEDGHVEVHDLGSYSGTYVDGQRVHGARRIAGGERIQIGRTTLVPSVADPAEEARALHDAGGQHEEPATAVVVKTEGQTVEVVPEGGEGAADAGAIRIATEGEAVEVVPAGWRRRMAERVRRNTVMAASAGALALAAVLALLLTRGDDRPTAAEIVEDARNRTVLIRASTGEEESGGSGWVLDADEGLVVTNFHVVNGGTRFQVGIGDDLRNADLVAAAPCDDLAVLRVGNHDDFETMPLASQDDVQQGDAVVAVGYPANASLDDELSSTAGVVSVVRSRFRFPSPDSPPFSNVIRTDAALSPGNSGGPLINDDKKLVGVNTAILTSLGGAPVQGQGYAIGVDRVKELSEDLRAGRSQGWAGFGLLFPKESELRDRNLPPGVVAGDPVPGTPAAESRVGGVLVTAINGSRVESTMGSYCDAVRSVRSGQTATLDVIAKPGGKPQRVKVKFP